SLGFQGRARGRGSGHRSARCEPRGRHLRSASDCRHGRGVRRGARAALSAWTDRLRSRAAGRLRLHQRHHPGDEPGDSLQRGGRPARLSRLAGGLRGARRLGGAADRPGPGDRDRRGKGARDGEDRTPVAQPHLAHRRRRHHRMVNEASRPEGGPRPLREREADPLGSVFNLEDLEVAARGRLSRMAYEYVSCGAADEITLGWNRSAFNTIRLRPRVLEDVRQIDLRMSLLGRTLPFPILLAPTAYHRVIHPEGEIATARGAGAAGATWVVSTGSNTSTAEIVAGAPAAPSCQLYLQSADGASEALVQRVEAAGVGALVLSVDTPVIGVRDRQTRSRFRLPPGVSTPHLDDLNRGRREILTPERVVATWEDVRWLQATARVPLLLKGILTAADAKRAASERVDGIILSNH